MDIRDDLEGAVGDYVQGNTTADDTAECPADSPWCRRVQAVASSKGVEASVEECAEIINAYRGLSTED